MTDIELNAAVPVALVAAVVVIGLAVCVRGLWSARGPVARLRWVPRVLIVLGVAVVSLRPTAPALPVYTLMSNADVWFVVDTTASMGALDGDGAGQARLDVARADAVKLLDTLGAAGARASLVTFDSEARTVVPLTSDTAAVARAVAVVRPEVAQGSQGTSISAALPLLARELRQAAERYPERSSVVVYLGDGEQTLDAQPDSFEPLAELVQGGLVLSYGTAAGAEMRAVQVGDAPPASVLDPATGAPAVSKADEQALVQVAEQLGVTHASSDGDPVPVVETPTVRIVSTDGGRVLAGSSEYTWIAALVVYVLVLLDLGGAAADWVTAAAPRGSRR